MIASFYITSLVLFTFFRYYFKPAAWLNSLRILAAIVYGAILPLLIALFTGVVYVEMVFLWIFIAVPVWVLMIDPKAYANGRGNYKQQSARISEELKRDYESKIPFELQNLSSIFLRSLSELFAGYKISFSKVYHYVLLFLTYYLGFSIFKHRMPIGILLVSFFIISLVLFTFFRYYFKPSTWPSYQRIAAAIAYGAILPLLITCFYLFTKMEVDFVQLIFIWINVAVPV